jgi:hypothetical protein
VLLTSIRALTHASHNFLCVQAKGKTVLYIPSRGKLPGAGQEYTDADAKDKDLVQQLESTLIHWTRQIKEVGSMHGFSFPKHQ